MLLKVHVKGTTTCKMLDVWSTMKLELINYVKALVLYYIEI
jgi:hypothetical protein